TPLSWSSGPGAPFNARRRFLGEVVTAPPLQPQDVHPGRHRAGLAGVVERTQSLLVAHGGASTLRPGVDVVALGRGVGAPVPEDRLVLAAQASAFERLSPLGGRERAPRVPGVGRSAGR